MIVGFSRHGQGGGRGPVGYLTGRQSPDGTVRRPAPVVLRGDPGLVGRLIDALAFQHRYTSGCLSFTPGEVVTPALEQAIMDGFERVAFAGLSPDRYSILWVRHSHAGHHELNFLVPRVELVTGKSLNIAPPGSAARALFDTFRSLVNASYGFADPDDPARARDVSLPNHLARLRADGGRKGTALEADVREAISEHVRREVEAGRIRDRAGVVAYLEGHGCRVPRQGAEYVTVELDATVPAALGRVRLRGGLYRVAGWTAQEPPTIRYGVADPERAAVLALELERLCAARARYHGQRYGVLEAVPPPGLAQGQTVEPLGAYLTRVLGDEARFPGHHGPVARSRQRRQRVERLAAQAACVGQEVGEAPPSGRAQGLRSVSPRTQREVVGPGPTWTGSQEAWLRWWAAYYAQEEPEQER